jgi:arsenite methyltransferase
MTADAAFWDNIAEEYSRKPVDLPEAFKRKIAVTKRHITPRSTVLDIGCGTGSLALRLASGAAHVHGLDVSPEMMRIARGKAVDQGAGNVSFHVGAFDDSFTVLEPGSVDVLCSYSLLHLVDDRDAALAAIFRLLKPGGVLVASTVCLGESWVPYRPLLWAMRLVGKAPMVCIVSKATLNAEIRAAGFVGLEEPDVGAGGNTSFLVARKPGG